MGSVNNEEMKRESKRWQLAVFWKYVKEGGYYYYY